MKECCERVKWQEGTIGRTLLPVSGCNSRILKKPGHQSGPVSKETVNVAQ